MSQAPIADFPFRLVDLTHPLSPDSPLWPGDPETDRRQAADMNQDDYMLYRWSLSEHAGTHTGAPAHFHPGGRSVDQLVPEELLWPAVILPIIDELPSDGLVSVSWLRAREVQWGHLLPKRAMVVLRTGWDERWPDSERVYETNGEGQFCWPGFSLEAAEWLIAERGVTGLGTDTPGIDPGSDSSFSVGRRCAEAGLPHLENLANLDHLPTIGAWILAAPLRLEKGSGSPSRVLGLVP